jgi:hypothetical protein
MNGLDRHHLDWVSLVAGVVFLVVAVTNLVAAATGESVRLGWLVPLGLLALGAAGLASALRGGRDTESSRTESDGAASGRIESDRTDPDRIEPERTQSGSTAEL